MPTSGRRLGYLQGKGQALANLAKQAQAGMVNFMNRKRQQDKLDKVDKQKNTVNAINIQKNKANEDFRRDKLYLDITMKEREMKSKETSRVTNERNKLMSQISVLQDKKASATAKASKDTYDKTLNEKQRQLDALGTPSPLKIRNDRRTDSPRPGTPFGLQRGQKQPSPPTQGDIPANEASADGRREQPFSQGRGRPDRFQRTSTRTGQSTFSALDEVAAEDKGTQVGAQDFYGSNRRDEQARIEAVQAKADAEGISLGEADAKYQEENNKNIKRQEDMLKRSKNAFAGPHRPGDSQGYALPDVGSAQAIINGGYDTPEEQAFLRRNGFVDENGVITEKAAVPPRNISYKKYGKYIKDYTDQMEYLDSRLDEDPGRADEIAKAKDNLNEELRLNTNIAGPDLQELNRFEQDKKLLNTYREAVLNLKNQKENGEIVEADFAARARALDDELQGNLSEIKAESREERVEHSKKRDEEVMERYARETRLNKKLGNMGFGKMVDADGNVTFIDNKTRKQYTADEAEELFTDMKAAPKKKASPEKTEREKKADEFKALPLEEQQKPDAFGGKDKTKLQKDRTSLEKSLDYLTGTPSDTEKALGKDMTGWDASKMHREITQNQITSDSPYMQKVSNTLGNWTGFNFVASLFADPQGIEAKNISFLDGHNASEEELSSRLKYEINYHNILARKLKERGYPSRKFELYDSKTGKGNPRTKDLVEAMERKHKVNKYPKSKAKSAPKKSKPFDPFGPESNYYK